MNRPRWVACIATVEWRAGGRGYEEPVAVRSGSRRLRVSVEERHVESGASAGSPLRRVFSVRDELGGRWRIAIGEDGRAMVERARLIP
ncbi:MAG TPA: hypothetical protein VLW17_14205 [Thermoanaerobaculaceae bacterium]|nr:hypothetical protein [Thermoanaerobaculaceae bacterium]